MMRFTSAFLSMRSILKCVPEFRVTTEMSVHSKIRNLVINNFFTYLL
uniref:Uncharacterized protein n=1 Tax=Arundo donax TaxID=35708 RepID=A0A0A9EN71_ARUDO